MKKILSCLITLTATPVFALDDCLIGNWAPDFAVMEQQLAAVAQAQSISISGDMIMTISADSTGAYQVNSLDITIENAAAPKTTVSLTGTGDFSTMADAGNFSFTMGAFDYAAVATIDMNGSPMTMDIPFSEEMAPMGGNSNGTYTCDASSVTFLVAGDGAQAEIVNRWTRR